MNRNTTRLEKDGPQKDDGDNIHASEILPLNIMYATFVGYVDWWEINSNCEELIVINFGLDKIHVRAFTHAKISSVDISSNMIIFKNRGIRKELCAKWSDEMLLQFNWRKVSVNAMKFNLQKPN